MPKNATRHSKILLVAGMLFLSTAAAAQIRVSVAIAPPALLAYQQPICPGDGYLWTPGYWNYDNDYYWVPGAWVMAPEPGFLWTPGYWGWGGGGYMFNEGYWGTSVGFYGGINYGFGYGGNGYAGGRWDGGHFFYNTAVNRVDVNSIHNVYNTRVNETANRVSYNGGQGGINARATPQEEAAGRERHIAPVAAQTQHAQVARNDPQQRFSANHGTAPGAAAGRSSAAVHPKELPAVQHPTAPNTGNTGLDKKYQKQQDKLVAQQGQDRQKLQQRQDQQHQHLTKQNANAAKTQQVEQQHQQQTERMQQGHTQQIQQMQQRQAPAAAHGGGRR